MSQSDSLVPQSTPPAPPTTAVNGPQDFPDVARNEIASVTGCLDRVGMSGIEVAARIPGPDGDAILVPATADAFVSLDVEDVKGIHMSRLFTVVQSQLEQQVLGPASIQEILHAFVESHHDICQRGYLSVAFDQLVRRDSLLSVHQAWRRYPVRLEGEWVKGTTRLWLTVRVTYSSTCPCSAALSRQALAEEFENDFAFHRWLSVSQIKDWLHNKGSLATPHSQRSHATVRMELDPGVTDLPIVDLVDRIESALATPVQATVKRADEQQFARLNGENLMFCEDAARRVKRAMDTFASVVDYRIEARHLESLHPHDAVAIVTKGVSGGMRP